jgi:hypothetical protein
MLEYILRYKLEQVKPSWEYIYHEAMGLRTPLSSYFASKPESAQLEKTPTNSKTYWKMYTTGW